MCVLRVSFIIWFFTSPTNLLRSSHHHLRADSAHEGKSAPLVQSGGSLPQKPRPMRGGHWSPDNPSSNQEASGRRRERVEWLSGPEYCSLRGDCFLSAVLVCSLWWGSSWWWWSSSQDHGLVDFGSWVRVPPWWVGARSDARGGKVPGQALFPQLTFSLG